MSFTSCFALDRPRWRMPQPSLVLHRLVDVSITSLPCPECCRWVKRRW